MFQLCSKLFNAESVTNALRCLRSTSRHLRPIISTLTINIIILKCSSCTLILQLLKCNVFPHRLASLLYRNKNENTLQSVIVRSKMLNTVTPLMAPPCGYVIENNCLYFSRKMVLRL